MSNNQPSDLAFKLLILQITDKNFLDNIPIKNHDSTSIIEKSIKLIKEEYSYSLSLQAQCVPDAKRMISQLQRKLEGLEALLTLSKLIN